MRASRQIPRMKDKSYNERLKQFKLPTLSYRTIHGGMIEAFKIINGIYDRNAAEFIKSWKDMTQSTGPWESKWNFLSMNYLQHQEVLICTKNNKIVEQCPPKKQRLAQYQQLQKPSGQTVVQQGNHLRLQSKNHMKTSNEKSAIENGWILHRKSHLSNSKNTTLIV